MKITRRALLASSAFLAGAALCAGAGVLPLQADDSSKLKLAVIPGLQAAPAANWEEWPKAGPVKGARVENFGVVLPGILYRSAQPGEGDFEWLAQQGIKSVVSLREEYDEAEDVKAAGLQYLYIPVTDFKIPTNDQVRQFLEFVHDSKNWPVVVHCKGGQGRAAIMSAIARYSMQGWDMGKALDEAKLYRPLNFPIYGIQKRFLNRWKDRFAAGEYHPSKSLPEWAAAAEVKKTASK